MAEDRAGTMTETKFTDPTSGWSAECRDCPAMTEPDYGATVYPRAEFTDADVMPRAMAEQWAAEHVAEHPGHRPAVGQWHRWTVEVTAYAADLIAAMFPVDSKKAQR